MWTTELILLLQQTGTVLQPCLLLLTCPWDRHILLFPEMCLCTAFLKETFALQMNNLFKKRNPDAAKHVFQCRSHWAQNALGLFILLASKLFVSNLITMFLRLISSNFLLCFFYLLWYTTEKVLCILVQQVQDVTRLNILWNSANYLLLKMIKV